MANNKVSKGSKGSKGSTAVPPRKEKNMSVDQILDALKKVLGKNVRNQNDEQETPDAN